MFLETYRAPPPMATVVPLKSVHRIGGIEQAAFPVGVGGRNVGPGAKVAARTARLPDSYYSKYGTPSADRCNSPRRSRRPHRRHDPMKGSPPTDRFRCPAFQPMSQREEPTFWAIYSNSEMTRPLLQ